MSDRQPVTIQKGERPIKTWYKWKALATVALGTFMGTMDVSIVNISFPILTRELNTDLTTVMWVTLAYILVSTSLMLFVGKTGDQVGRKKIYAAGMLIFTLGLVSCSLAHSITQLIVFRIFQALGAAMAISCGTAIVTEAFPPEERGQGLGLVGVSVSAGFILGPIIGGFLLEWFHWRSIFYTRVPVAFLTFIMALILLEKDHVKDGKIELDLLGTVTSSVGLASIIFGVSQINRFGLTSPLILLLIGLGILSLIAFIFVENRASDPIVDLSLFKNLRFSSATGALFLTFLAYPAFTLVIPFFLIQGVGLMPAKAGFVMASVSMTAIIIGPISGWLSDRFGPVWFSTLGAMCSSVAFSLMRGFDLQTQIIGIVLILSTFGFGIGLFQAPNNSIIMGSVKKENLGTASALMATLRSVGIAVGTAVAGTVYSVRKIIHAAALSQQGVEAGYANKQAVSLAFHDVLIASIIFMALVVVLSLGTRIRENA
ncbi:MAG: MFS transporter [Deltaproteobacteria bacterium]|nr:MFS transporter [Deltaproteobacteria bacterium]MBW2139448.1 MFS transporter [Deltaproteobacteria bacterium]